MAWFKRSSRFRILATILLAALTLCLVVNIPAQVQAQLRPSFLMSKLPDQLPDRWDLGFRAPRGPGGPAPDNTASGGTRNPDSGYGCKGAKGIPVSLVPAPSLTGTTIADYPSFFWYMPPTSAPAAEFLLLDAQGEDIYRAQYTLAKSTQDANSTPSIMSFSLPAYANISPLSVGEKYHWTLALICDPLDRSGDIATEGWIQRVQPDATLASRIQQATPQERIALYANARLWYETLTTLDELRRDRPDNTDLAQAWNKLLKSAGLELIAQK
ncbi:MAG TPA: DUF928 domain-containing protein [Coleofasciculaceae cyanobacterium]